MAAPVDGSTERMPELKHLLPPLWESKILEYLKDDVPTFDIGGYVVGDKVETAILLGKSKGVLAGVPFVDAVFKEVGCTVKWLMKEGDTVEPICHVAEVTGPVRNILMGERTALNIMTRASGIATEARVMADVKAAHGWHGEVAGTRKITPGFRMVEKYALLVGGVSTHRMDLSSMVMLKDNHIWSMGSITKAVEAARKAGGFSIKIEVEARTLEEATEACKAGADIVMLDNYEPEDLKKDAEKLKAEFPHVIVEASGGIRADTMSKYFSPFVDVVSCGALTQGYKTLDFSLKIRAGRGVELTSVADKK